MAQQTTAAGKVPSPATGGDRTTTGDRYVRYIEKTHAYYRRKGTGADYLYAHHTDGPFTPLRKPLAESRLVLVTSAGLEIVPEGGPVPVPFKGINVGPKDLVEVFDIPGDLPTERLVYVTGAHNRAESPMTDVNAFFPVTAVRALQREGRIGSLAPNFLRIRPAYSQRKTRELDAPEVLRRCQALGVDVALLVPVWPVCHQTVSLVARHLEANGIPTVMLASARDITESAFPPRAVFVNYPLGNTAGRPFDPANQRAIVSRALDVLESATHAGTLVDTPHRWRQDEGWMERVYDEKH